MKYLALLVLASSLVGCATARTSASVSQRTADGFEEVVTFETDGVVTWGSAQELQEGNLNYTWNEDTSGGFSTGGSATNQKAADPVTEMFVRVIEKMMERALPVPAPVEPDRTEE